MFRRRVRSAVFVDFDNIVSFVGARFGDNVDAWMAWLEDARFEAGGRRRRFLARRVYWNSQNEKWRPVFEAADFTALECRSLVKTKKSAADMMIALDAQALSYNQPDIDEYIVLTTDTDFVPLLNHLDERDKRTVAAANPTNLSFHVYTDHADIAISTDELRAACEYRRPIPAALRIWRKLAGAAVAAGAWTATRPGAIAAALRRAPPTKGASEELIRAAEIVAEVARPTPGLPVSRKAVVRALSRRMETFSTTGARPHLGCGSYAQMLAAIAPLRRDLRLHRYPNGGAAISYRA